MSELIEALAELVAECGRGAAYDLRERFGIDLDYTQEQRALLPAQLAVALRAELIATDDGNDS